MNSNPLTENVDVGTAGGDIVSGGVGERVPGSNASRSKTQEPEAGVIARDFVLFCEKQGLDVHDYDVSLKVCVLLSLDGVDVKSLGDSLFPGVFVDWKRLSENERGVQHKGCNIFENNAVTWIRILQFFHVDQEGIETPPPSVLVDYQDLLKTCKMDIELPHMARLFVLSCVNNQPMLDTVSEYYRIIFPKDNIGKKAQQFVGQYVDNRGKFERDNYFHGIKWVLKHLHVRDNFKKELRYYFDHRSEMESRMILRTVQLQRGRPCIRDRLSSLDSKKPHVMNSTTTQETRDKFRMWCSRVRFPNNVCLWLRQKLYFLRCQRFDNLLDIENSLERVLQEIVSHDVAKAVCECSIAYPDTEVIDSVITRMLFHRQPFPEMLEFRADAFIGFAHSRSQMITNPQIMQLYTAAYQHKSPWQEHWKKIVPIMNHTTITHVEKFVQTHPINMQAILQTLVSS
jgi:hypothetical protein